MIEIDLRLLRAAVVVAKELNISRAASRLRISQPALTKQIQELEDRVGERLFDRDTQKVELTDAGRAFVAEAAKSLFHRDRAVEVARSVARGAEVVLNTPPLDVQARLISRMDGLRSLVASADSARRSA